MTQLGKKAGAHVCIMFMFMPEWGRMSAALRADKCLLLSKNWPRPSECVGVEIVSSGSG